MADVKAACIAVQREVDTGENVQITLDDISLLNTGKLNPFLYFLVFNLNDELTLWVAHREGTQMIKVGEQ